MYDVIVIGGGAAGFYGAIQTALNNSSLKIAIFERGKTVLGKVKVSGGGRCNVAHAEFDPTSLRNNYPRGNKALLGPFHTHSSGDVMEFFEDRGVSLKIESDGRIFPVSNSSQTIIDCFLSEVKKMGITVLRNSSVKQINESDKIKNGWRITTMNKHYHAKKVLVATGSNPKIWDLVKKMGHTIIAPVPSLFTFNIKDDRIEGLQGLSVGANVEILPKNKYNTATKVELKSKFKERPLFSEEGPLLITHWGLSGPAILKLSAWAARELHDFNYRFRIKVNWCPEHDIETIFGLLNEVKIRETVKTVVKTNVVDLPSRLWTRLVKFSGIHNKLNWSEVNKKQLSTLAEQLTESLLIVEGKSTFKEEFVTAGGVELNEVDFKTFESKLLPNLYFAGEVLNIDAVTGGFNFQNAWTGAYIAAQNMAKA